MAKIKLKLTCFTILINKRSYGTWQYHETIKQMYYSLCIINYSLHHGEQTMRQIVVNMWQCVSFWLLVLKQRTRKHEEASAQFCWGSWVVELQTTRLQTTDYEHTKAKSLIFCGPNSNPNPKKIFGIGIWIWLCLL